MNPALASTATAITAEGERFLRLVPSRDDFKPDVAFRDIMPLLADAAALRYARHQLVEWAAPLRPDYVAAVDARGFILGSVLASDLGCGLLTVRKAGKLPGPLASTTFSGEYATDTLQMRTDLLPAGARVLVHDDMLATGNCLRATAELVRNRGGEVVGLCSLIEKAFLDGRSQIVGYPFRSVFQYHV
jgi:adenine phosphoribosyltransferase